MGEDATQALCERGEVPVGGLRYLETAWRLFERVMVKRGWRMLTVRGMFAECLGGR